jgi:hypothetical protein
LTSGCPYELPFDEDESNNITATKRGNQKSVDRFPKEVAKILNKEDRYSHLLHMDDWVYKLGPHLRHTAEGYLWKKGKGRMVWDGSTTYTLMEVVMNEITQTENKAEITFGMVNTCFIG